MRHNNYLFLAEVGENVIFAGDDGAYDFAGVGENVFGAGLAAATGVKVFGAVKAGTAGAVSTTVDWPAIVPPVGSFDVGVVAADVAVKVFGAVETGAVAACTTCVLLAGCC